MTAELKRPPTAPTTSGRRLQFLVYLLVCIPPALTLWAIHEFGINVPYYDDDWDFTGAMLDRWLQGKLTLGLFFAQHMEHRVLMPRVVLFCVALVTHWQTKAGMYANFVVVLGIAALLIRLLARTVPIKSAAAIFATILTSALLFGLIQWEIWLWSPGMQITVIALLLVAGFSIAKASLRFSARLLLCALLALLATYSSGNGFLLWILLPPVLFVEGGAREKRRIWLGILWVAVAAIGVALYFVHYVTPPGESTRAAGSWPQTFLFFLRYLGASVGSGTGQPEAYSLGAGIVLLCISIGAVVFVFSRRNAEILRASMPWLCLGAYAVMTGAMIALARSGGGAFVAMSSRYIGYSVYLPVALACLGAIILSRPRAKYFAVGFMLLLLILHVHTTVGAMTWMELARSVRAQARCTLRYLDLVSSEQITVTLSPDPENVREAAHRLDKGGYLQPALAQTDEVPEDSVTPDHVPGAIVEMQRAGDSFHVLGWITPAMSSDPIGAVALTRLRADGKYVIVAISTGAARTDTSEPMETLISPVWHAEIPVDRLPEDQPVITLWGIHANSFRFTRLEAPEPSR